MTNTQLATNFEKIYEELRLYTKKALIHYQTNLDVDAVINESYIHANNNRNQIESINDLTALCKFFIKQNLRWTNGAFRKEKLNSLEVYDSENYDEINLGTTSEFLDISFEDFIEEFESELNTYSKGLLDIYQNNQINTIKEIHNHLNISMKLAYQVYNDIKDLEQKMETMIKNKY